MHQPLCERMFTLWCEDCTTHSPDNPCSALRCTRPEGHDGDTHLHQAEAYTVIWHRHPDEPTGPVGLEERPLRDGDVELAPQ